MRNLYKVLSEKYLLVNEQEEKTGDVTPDGESTLEMDKNGAKVWRNKHGRLHRLDGPAVEYTYTKDGKEYFIDGKAYYYEDWKKEVEHRKNLANIHKKGSEDSGLNIGALNEKKEKTGDVSPDGESTLLVNRVGTKYWYDEQGEWHRRNGPAIEWPDGSKAWFVNGKRHRRNGPAAEWTNGDKGWWINGKRHRLDGPAVVYLNGTKEWWIDGIEYSYEDWKKEVEHRKNLDTIYGKGKEIDLNLKGFNA